MTMGMQMRMDMEMEMVTLNGIHDTYTYEVNDLRSALDSERE